ncbi:MAG: hypothetical protein V1692_00455 [bacterium]
MPIFKRKDPIPVKTDQINLPEAVRQILREKKLPAKTREGMIKAFQDSKMKAGDIRKLMAGEKKINEREFNELGKALVKNKVPGLAKYSSGNSLVNTYVQNQQKKQARFRLFRQQRDDEDLESQQKPNKAVSLSDRRGAIGSALDNKRADSSALSNKQATTSAFTNLPTSSIANSPKDRPPRINLPV